MLQNAVEVASHLLVEEHIGSLYRHEHVRRAVVIAHRVAVRLDRPGTRQKVPCLAVRAEEVGAQDGGGAALVLVPEAPIWSQHKFRLNHSTSPN